MQSGKNKFGERFTNQLKGMMLVDDNSIIDNEAVLKQLKKIIQNAVPDKCDTRSIHIYYTGHGGTGTGNWVFAGGSIVTL